MQKKQIARFMKHFSLLLPLAAVFLLASCRSTTQTRLFLLTEDESLQRLPNVGIQFELRPITLPNYLNRREFIKRIGDNEIQVLRSNLWAETTEYSVNSVFTQNLKALLGEDNVLPYGKAKDDTPILHIDIHRLEMNDDQFIADFRCRLKRQGAETIAKRFVWETPASTNVAYVTYYKQSLSEISKQVADWLLKQATDK